MTRVVGRVLAPGRRQDLVSALDWDCLCRWRPSVLLEGSRESTARLVRLLEPHFPRPVRWTRAGAALALPAGGCGTLVLQDVAALDRKAQVEVLRWLDDVHDRKRLVATTVRPLFAPVRRGLFDEALYYRLNVMLLRVGEAASGP